MGWATLVSVMRQVAGLIPSPRPAHRPAASSLEAPGAERCGHCPACQAFVCLGAAGPDGMALCPRCDRAIAAVEPLA
jgi:hypothetical protein